MAESRAVQRLRVVLDRTAAAGDHGAWLSAAESLLAALERQDPDGRERAGLRAQLLDACNALRTVPRSRVGREWGAITADQAIGPVLRDVLDDPVVDAGEVFALAESGRSRVLLDVLSGCFAGDSGRPEELELTRSVFEFSEDEDDTPVHREMRLQSAVRPLSMDEEGMARRSAAVAAVEALYADGEHGFVSGSQPVTLADLQAALGQQDLLVEYVIPYHAMHPAFSLAAVLVTRDAATVVNLPLPDPVPGKSFIGAFSVDGRAPLDASPLGELVLGARLAIQGGSDPLAWAQSRRLHQLLVEPLLADPVTQGRGRWVVIPHRQLHPVPWMALVDADGVPWLVQHSVVLCPSASVWHRLHGRHPSDRAALALGNPPLGYAGAPPLPGAADEVEHLRATWTEHGWPVVARTGLDATAKAFLELCGQAGLLHLATHGSTPRVGATVEQSVLLGVAAGAPGAVGVEALRRADLKASWLTTLSICDGGVYFVGQGDELLGLVAAALQAGTSSVVAAQWAVDDDAGRRLMSAFIDRLAGSDDPADSLRQAALELAGSGAPMREWAPFVLTGSGRGVAADDARS